MSLLCSALAPAARARFFSSLGFGSDSDSDSSDGSDDELDLAV